jgi:hypothetical protein
MSNDIKSKSSAAQLRKIVVSCYCVEGVMSRAVMCFPKFYFVYILLVVKYVARSVSHINVYNDIRYAEFHTTLRG